MDGDVGGAGAFEERSADISLANMVVGVEGSSPEDARGDVAAAADCDYEVRLEVVEDALGCCLALLVDLRGNHQIRL